ncbi:glycoside hydrolase family 10 protein [Porphyromonas levii]|uniref:glycoside hydrolase family 10 protein n=1 Tax=Porphyromonas levii TaxID=28114 RepID=UPI001F0D2119|nr:family 10 glycosylhydrolase [Porphyromonas levii]
MRDRVRRVLVALVLALLVWPVSAVDLRPKHDMKAVWLTTIYGLDWPRRSTTSRAGEEQQKRELVRMLDELKAIGTNTVFLQVRGRGRLIYPSKVEPMSTDFVPANSGYTLGYDPLAFAIEECHKRGMTLHAWLVVTPIGNNRNVQDMPSWAYPKQHRSDVVRYKGHWYMDPSKPATSKHMRAIVKELLANYDIAGVHLDYIRYPDRAKDFPDKSRFNAHNGCRTLEDWRRENINKIVAEVYEEVKAHSPFTLLSASVLGTYDNVPGLRESGWTAYNEVWQDPVAWSKAGTIDFVVPMMYQRGDRFYPYVKEWQKVLAVPLVVGMGPYMVMRSEGDWPLQEVKSQLQYLDTIPDLAGTAMFRAEHALSNSLGTRKLIAEDWLKSASLSIDRGVALEWMEEQELLLEGVEEGLHISWKRTKPHQLFALYLRTDGEVPSGEEAPYLTTMDNQVVLPWSAFTAESLIGIKVGEYDLVTNRERQPVTGSVYYYRALEDGAE